MLAIFASALGAAALGIGSSLLQNKSGAPEQSLGSNTSGNVTDVRPGLIARTNQFLGTQVGGIAKDVGGSFLGDYRQRRNSLNRFKDLKSEGLTPQEIAGSSGGGAVQAQGNTLGSGPMVQAQSQRDFIEGENAKNRALEKYKVDKQTDIPQEIAQKNLEIHKEMSLAQIRSINKTADKIGMEFKLKEHEYNNRWQLLAAKMGRENMEAAIAMSFHGLDLEAILRQLPLRDEQRLALQLAWQDMNNPKSIMFRNLSAIGSIISQRSAGEHALPTLGRYYNPSEKRVSPTVRNMKNQVIRKTNQNEKIKKY